MNKKHLIFIILTFLIATICFSESAEKGSPEWLVQQYFLEAEFPEMNKYVTAEEYDRITTMPSLGSIFKEAVDSGYLKIEYKQLEENDSSSIYSVTLISDKVSTDAYLFMEKEDSIWKIRAFRELALTGIIYGAIEEFEKMDSIPDSMKFQYQNCKLTVASDSEIKEHFLTHQKEFDEIISIFEKDQTINDTKIALLESVPKTYSTNEQKIIDLQEKLFIQAIHRKKMNIVFLIGGVTDNAVEYMYIPDEADAPQMSPNEYIFVEKVADNWYIVKET